MNAVMTSTCSCVAMAVWLCLAIPALAGTVVPPGTPSASPPWRRVWTYPAGRPLAGAPAALNGGWVAATGDGRILAVDSGGKLVWSHAVSNATWVGTPAVAGPTVVVAGDNGRVLALDAGTGKPRWQVDVQATWLHGPLAVRAGDAWRIVLLSNSDGALHCLDDADGRPVWQSEPTNRSDGPPATDGRIIAYGNCDSAVHVFDVATGKKRASIPVGADAQMAGGVAIRDGYVYGGTRAGALVCVDVAAGNVRWQAQVSTGEAFVTPFTAGDSILMGTAEGMVIRVEALNGKERWRTPVNRPVSALAVMEDTVFVVAGGTLEGLRLADGAGCGSLAIGDRVEGPVVNGGLVLVAGDGGELVAVARREPEKGAR